MRTGIHAKWWCNQIPSTKSDSSSLLGHDKMGLRIHWDMEQDNLSGYSRLWTSHWDITNMFIFNRQPHTIEASGYRWRGEVTTCTDPPQSNTAGTLPSMCTQEYTDLNHPHSVTLKWGEGEVRSRRVLTHCSLTQPVLFPVCVHKNILIWITLTQSHWNEVRERWGHDMYWPTAV